jgi:hypothetical protein
MKYKKLELSELKKLSKEDLIKHIMELQEMELFLLEVFNFNDFIFDDVVLNQNRYEPKVVKPSTLENVRHHKPPVVQSKSLHREK